MFCLIFNQIVASLNLVFVKKNRCFKLCITFFIYFIYLEINSSQDSSIDCMSVETQLIYVSKDIHSGCSAKTNEMKRKEKRLVKFGWMAKTGSCILFDYEGNRHSTKGLRKQLCTA